MKKKSKRLEVRVKEEFEKLVKHKYFSLILRFILLLFLLSFVYNLFVVHLDKNEFGISRNFFTGTMERVDPGWSLGIPWVGVSVIDTRPIRVEVSSTCRAKSAKLVQFNPDEWETFVKTEGWRYYWWDNRISFNWGYDEEYRGMKNILRGYAYSKTKYPFIKILEEY